MTSVNISSTNFTKYFNEFFHFEFEYPIDWNLQIQKIPDDEEKYRFIIFFIGPSERSTGNGYSLLSLWISPSPEKGNSIISVNNYIGNIQNGLSEETSKIIGSRLEQIADINGKEIEYIIDTFRPLRLPKQFQKLVIEHNCRVVIEKNDYLYDLRFSASEADYPAQYNIYQHAKKTFKFIK
jgi:hypothetical protein